MDTTSVEVATTTTFKSKSTLLMTSSSSHADATAPLADGSAVVAPSPPAYGGAAGSANQAPYGGEVHGFNPMVDDVVMAKTFWADQVDSDRESELPDLSDGEGGIINI
jgi:hypothetical protein